MRDIFSNELTASERKEKRYSQVKKIRATQRGGKSLTPSENVKAGDSEKDVALREECIIKAINDNNDIMTLTEKNTRRKQISRSSQDVAEKEKARNRAYKRQTRVPRIRKRDWKRDRVAHLKARAKKEYREAERRQDAEAKTRKRILEITGEYEIKERHVK